MLNAIDTFMLCTVVHKNPLYILHPRNEQDIADKNSNSDQTFYDRLYKSGRNNFVKQTGNKNMAAP